jgi:Ca2+-binding EF-hand superfamily protein
MQFSLFDLDRDRHLDFHELRVALRALGFSLPKPELLEILGHSGVPRQVVQKQSSSRNIGDQQQPPVSQLLISQQAFAQVAAQRMLAREPQEEINRAFDLFDSDQKGYIDLDDLKKVARELGETGLEEDELRAMIEEFDLDGKGGVGREAFINICLQ